MSFRSHIILLAAIVAMACESEVNTEPATPTDPYSNKILYTAAEKIATENIPPSAFNATIISHTFDGEDGVIVFDSNLLTIGSYAFADCSLIESITLPNSVVTMGEGVFRGCTNLHSVTLSNNLTAISNELFYGCNNLTDVVIPERVTTIGIKAFGRCTSLSRINIPPSVVEVMPRAFNGCNNLKRIDIASVEHWLSIDLTEESDGTSKNYAIAPDSGCDLYIDGEPLTELVIPESKRYVDELRFAYISSIHSVIMHDKVKDIGFGAFCRCDNITSLTLGSSTRTIYDQAFLCKNLVTIYCKATIPPTMYSDSCFEYPVEHRVIYVPAEAIEAYQRDPWWGLFYYEYAEYQFE